VSRGAFYPTRTAQPAENGPRFAPSKRVQEDLQMTKKMKSLAVVSALLLAAACGSTDTGNMSSSSSMNGMNMNGTMTGPDIAGILTMANQGEIDAGQLASTKAVSPSVRDFANMMVRDHTGALSDARAVFDRSHLVPHTTNSTATSLQDLSNRTKRSLDQYSGSAFDRTYMQSQVDMHNWLLNQIDTTLLPSSRGDLHTLLVNQRATVAAHLDRARTILNSL
jgi:putative membrane protein